MNDLRLRATAYLGAGVIRSLAATWRMSCTGTAHYEAALRHHPNVIFAIWHGRLLPMCWSHRNRNIQVLASEHRDGELLGLTIRRFGFGHVRGSSTRGGARALRELSRCVRDGMDVGFTVDGPTGPRHRVKPGALEVARLTGAAVLPLTAASRRHCTFASWDAFELPHAFTRVRVHYGPPVMVARDARAEALELARQELESTLNRITAEADVAVKS